jgi:methyl-accepting chemotaxis protein
MIYVPASTVIRNARQSFVWIMGLVAVIFAAVIFLVNRWLNRYVVRPINRMAQVAESVSTGDTDTEFEWVSNDEVGSLAEAFTRMKMSLVMAMKRLDKYSSGHRSTEHSQQ